MKSYVQGFMRTILFQNSSKSARLPAIGAATIGTPSSPGMEEMVPHVGKRPTLPFKPQMPQKCAGMRALPPISVAISILLPPHASNAAPPPVDAPTV